MKGKKIKSMRKIKLTESQILMLQKFENGVKRKTILKINEEQFDSIFKGGTSNSKMDKEIKKIKLGEDKKIKDINLVDFAQEVIVFVKDVITNPKTMVLSPFWDDLGISKSKLFKMVKKEGLLSLKDDSVKEYHVPKIGFRKKIKELYKKVEGMGSTLNEFDAGYPAGADSDSDAPYNQNDEYGDDVEAIKAEREVLRQIYFNDKMDGLSIFKDDNGELYFIILSDILEDLTPYEDIEGYPNADTVKHYVNDKIIHGEMRISKDKAIRGVISLITPQVKKYITNIYGDDEELIEILNIIPESTGAASSGAFVGAMSTGINRKNLNNSPENSMRGLGTETTTTTSVGGDSGTFAYDAPAGDGNGFWTKGNEENKGNTDRKTKGMPIVKSGIFENSFNVGQIYKNGLARRKIIKVNKNLLGAVTSVNVRQWGEFEPENGMMKSKGGRNFTIDIKDWGNYQLIEGKVTLKISEEQLKRIIEGQNTIATAYPNGEMVTFDDCTKLNNNKVAQNGGCSQGAIDNVVKYKKTKNSVVSEGQFNPNVAAGSTYAIEVKANGAKVILTQDNGQTVVVHVDDIPDLSKVLNNFN